MKREEFRPAAVTIVARNYVPFARVLCNSFLKHHPNGRFFVFLVDELRGAFDPSTERFELVEFDSLRLPRGDWFRYQYSVLELSTAVKPFLLRYLFDKYDLQSVLYLDPDLYIKSPLTSINDALARSAIVLTPHMFAPPPEDGKHPTETDIMHSGTFNLGFLGVRNCKTVLDLLDWWSERLATKCLVDLRNAIFVDQRWMDLAPSYFDGVEILRDPALNVAYWNLHERELTCNGGRYYANGLPLVFFHFSGFDPRNNSTLSKHQTRHTLHGNHALQSLASEYASDLFANGYEDYFKIPNAFSSLSNGVQLGRLTQFVIRCALDKTVSIPSPKEEPDAFCRFLMTPNFLLDRRAIAPILLGVEEYRGDVRAAFPSAFEASHGAKGIVEWVTNSGGKEEGITELFQQYGHLIDRVGVVQHAVKTWTNREDLQKAFPKAFGGCQESHEFARWIERYGTIESGFAVGDGNLFLDRRKGVLRVLMLYLQDPNLQKEFPFLFVEALRQRFVRWLYEEACTRNIVSPEDVAWFDQFVRPNGELIAAITFGHSAWLQGNLVGGGSIFDLRNVRDLLGSYEVSISELELLRLYSSPLGRSLISQAEQYYLFSPEARERFPKAFTDLSVFDQYIEYLRCKLDVPPSKAHEQQSGHNSGMLSRVRSLISTKRQQPKHVVSCDSGTSNFDPISVGSRLKSEAEEYKRAGFGVNLAGYVNTPTGMGESARSMARTLDASGILYHVVPLPSYSLDPRLDVEDLTHGDLARSHKPAYRVNLVISNGDDYRHVRGRLPYAFWANRTNIGYWVWETEELPKEHSDHRGLTEIWTPSEYSAAAIRRAVDIPVWVVPHALDFSEIDASTADRAKFDLPREKVLFGFFFDSKSIFERKNPAAVIQAFRQAFAGDANAVLVLKVSSTEQAPQQFARLKRAAEGLNVVWITDVLSRADTLALMKSLDVYVSLHRSEGFGLTCAEAMAMGKPVIGTGYSGNVDFMDQHNSCLVDYQILETKERFGAYPRGTIWSDPDVDQASEYMRELLEPEKREEIGGRAAQSIREKLSPDLIGRLVSKRLGMQSLPSSAGLESETSSIPASRSTAGR